MRILIVFLCVCWALFMQAQSRYALTVGISDYSSYDKGTLWSNINGANDSYLLEKDLSKFGFEVCALLDGKATYKNIVSAMDNMIQRAKAGDMVFLHFSCHGQPIEDLDQDEADGWDEALIPVDAKLEYVKRVYEGECHLTDDVLNGYTQRLREKLGEKGCLYVVVDACHAGKMERGFLDFTDTLAVRGVDRGFSFTGKAYKSFKINRNDYFEVKDMQGSADVFFLEACRSHEVNKEISVEGTAYGPLSYYIHKVLSECRQDPFRHTGWIKKVKKCMKEDVRLKNQHMVVESSVPF